MDFQQNKRLKLAFDYVQYTGTNIFLTGKAGTGKTTFLKHLKENSPKRMVVVAPTGVAAINAGGVTIHSFFQLTPGPQLPDELSSEKRQENKLFRFRKSKIDIIKSLELLIIDEISMVRADLLDGIDRVLRNYRNNDRPFGGVQLLMIGDLQQLSPVIKGDEWELLKDHYSTPYFFSSNALLKTQYVTIELEHVYRQKEEAFVELLNRIRDNELDDKLLRVLNERYIPDFDEEKEGYIILTTHNYKANKINEERLLKLKGKSEKYKAFVSGSFPDYTFPTEAQLELKVGAQVMFVKNDPLPEKRFYNGKIGTVVELKKDSVMVMDKENEELIEVTPLVWEKIKYEIEPKTKKVKEEVEGMFTQIPLKLAWAITIHKSQGLTFDKVIIDAGQAFAHGQVYVALSRCRSLEGIVLKTPINRNSIKQDVVVKHFSEKFHEHQPDRHRLESDKKKYQLDLLLDLFSFSNLQRNLSALWKTVNDFKPVLQSDPLPLLSQMQQQFGKDVVEVAAKFRKQLLSLANETKDVTKDHHLQDRVQKGVAYFLKKLEQLIIQPLEHFSFETDNQETEKKIEERAQTLYAQTRYKIDCLKSCEKGFELKKYLQDKAVASLKDHKLKKTKQTVAEDVPHPELYNRLKAWRNAVAAEEEKLVFLVLPLKTIGELCKKLPVSLSALKQVKGFGKVKLEKYGKEIIDIVTDYCDEMNIKPPSPPKENKKEKKLDTKHQTWQLWKKGATPQEIAKERGLALTTIVGHLAHGIAEGEVDVFKLVPEEKVEKISNYFLNSESKQLKEAKEILGEDYSYDELRYVLNHLIHTEKI